MSFLPETSRNSDGSLTVRFGKYFPGIALVLKRAQSDGMYEQAEIDIDTEVRRKMSITLATAGREGYDADVNLDEWHDLGVRAKNGGDSKYDYADILDYTGGETLGEVVDKPFLSLRTTNAYVFKQQGVKEWRSDLPCIKTSANSSFATGPIEVFDGSLPNLVNGKCMFSNCSELTTFTSEMPVLVEGGEMFAFCSSLASFSADLHSLVNA